MNGYQDKNVTEAPRTEMEKIKDLQGQLRRDIEDSQKSNDTEDRFDTIAYGTFSMLLARFFIRHGISANTVTLRSLVV